MRFHILLGVLALWMNLAVPARAASPCGIGFLSGPVSAVVDANLDAEWTGAGVSLISSSSATTSPCAEQLGDIGGVTGNINVYSKRYTRAGNQYVGMLFDIDDPSSCTASPTCLGERIVILLDPNGSGGTSLQNTAGTTPAAHLASDYKIVLSHYWDFTGTTRPATVEVFKKSSILCGAVNPWESTPLTLSAVTDGVITFKIINRSTVLGATPGYRAEIEIPLLLLGNPTGDIGAAFAVINDTGVACVTCFDYTSSFPNSIPLNDGDNPIDPCGASWTVPNSWGTGFFTTPPAADVTLSHIPDFYLSEDVDAISCSTVNNIYYPSGPCKMAINARPRKGAGPPQSRNLLYLWGEPGIGQTVWKVVELKAVSVSSTLTWIASAEVPSAELASVMGHPCVRVYILPPVFVANFPSTRILAITTNAELLAMETAYGVLSQHIAQQNISGDGVGLCPIAGCQISRLTPPGMPGSFPTLTGAFLPPQRPVQQASSRVAGNPDAPRAPNVGTSVILSDEQFARLRGNILVRIVAFGSPTTLRQSPSGYHFAEKIGALVKVFQVAQLRRGATLPLVFVLGNPRKVQMEIFLQVDMYVPPGVDRPDLRLNTGPFRLDPQESTVQRGALGPADASTSTGGFKHLTFGVLFGANIPIGELGKTTSTGPSFSWDLEYRLNGSLSVQLLAGEELFCRTTPPGTACLGYLAVTHISGALRYYIPISGSGIRPFVLVGGGYYGFHPGSSHGGLQVGAGWLIDLTPRVGFETAVRYHSTDALPSDRANFLTVQGGLRFRF